MSPEADDDGLSPQMCEHVAHVITKTLATVAATPSEGCAILALSYAIWCEAEPDADADLLATMLATSVNTTRESFRILREMRGHREALFGGIFPKS